MTDEQRDLVVRRVVMASRETAFEAWTTPEHVAQWWRPSETSRCTNCEIDLRVGGRYRIQMVDSADDTTCDVEGVFREIALPERLVYTWNAKTHLGDVENSLVTVTFRALGDEATEVVVRHGDLPDTPVGEGHQEGWAQVLASYARHVASGGPGGGDDFRMRLTYDVPAERLFEQFSSAEGVAHWWTKDCDVDPRVGGQASFRFGDAGFYANVTIATFDPPRAVAWKVDEAKHPESTGFSDLRDWNGTTIRFEITRLSDDRARLDFTHAGLGPLECAGVCSSLWAYYLNDSLRSYLEKGEGKPNP